MNHVPNLPAPGAARIPPPPPGGGRRRPRTSDRLLVWFGAFAVGVGLGFAAYQFLGVTSIFDGWLALLG